MCSCCSFFCCCSTHSARATFAQFNIHDVYVGDCKIYYILVYAQDPSASLVFTFANFSHYTMILCCVFAVPHHGLK